MIVSDQWCESRKVAVLILKREFVDSMAIMFKLFPHVSSSPRRRLVSEQPFSWHDLSVLEPPLRFMDGPQFFNRLGKSKQSFVDALNASSDAFQIQATFENRLPTSNLRLR